VTPVARPTKPQTTVIRKWMKINLRFYVNFTATKDFISFAGQSCLECFCGMLTRRYKYKVVFSTYQEDKNGHIVSVRIVLTVYQPYKKQ
jgi:hypothetical protein